MGRSTTKRPCGFTLVELLVVVAMIALLLAILLPSLARARRQAKITKVHAELRNIGTALSAYFNEYNDYPLASSYCAGQAQSMAQYFELPTELFAGGYLTGRIQADSWHEYHQFQDPFDPNRHSYKYIKPGVAWGNNRELTKYRIWAPTEYPEPAGEPSDDPNDDTCYPTYKRNPDPDAPPNERWIVDAHSPVAYALWSCGPGGPVGWLSFQESQMTDGSHLPVPSRNWYPNRGPDGESILCHVVTSKYYRLGEGHVIISP